MPIGRIHAGFSIKRVNENSCVVRQRPNARVFLVHKHCFFQSIFFEGCAVFNPLPLKPGFTKSENLNWKTFKPRLDLLSFAWISCGKNNFHGFSPVKVFALPAIALAKAGCFLILMVFLLKTMLLHLHKNSFYNRDSRK